MRSQKKKKEKGEELQLLKHPAKKEERAVNLEEIRLPWKPMNTKKTC